MSAYGSTYDYDEHNDWVVVLSVIEMMILLALYLVFIVWLGVFVKLFLLWKQLLFYKKWFW
jgi:hypothetical protein